MSDFTFLEKNRVLNEARIAAVKQFVPKSLETSIVYVSAVKWMDFGSAEAVNADPESVEVTLSRTEKVDIARLEDASSWLGGISSDGLTIVIFHESLITDARRKQGVQH